MIFQQGVETRFANLQMASGFADGLHGFLPLMRDSSNCFKVFRRVHTSSDDSEQFGTVFINHLLQSTFPLTSMCFYMFRRVPTIRNSLDANCEALESTMTSPHYARFSRSINTSSARSKDKRKRLDKNVARSPNIKGSECFCSPWGVERLLWKLGCSLREKSGVGRKREVTRSAPALAR